VKPPGLGDVSVGRASTLHLIPLELLYNWEKSRKTSVRVYKGRSVDQRRTRFV